MSHPARNFCLFLSKKAMGMAQLGLVVTQRHPACIGHLDQRRILRSVYKPPVAGCMIGCFNVGLLLRLLQKHGEHLLEFICRISQSDHRHRRLELPSMLIYSRGWKVLAQPGVLSLSRRDMNCFRCHTLTPRFFAEELKALSDLQGSQRLVVLPSLTLHKPIEIRWVPGVNPRTPWSDCFSRRSSYSSS